MIRVTERLALRLACAAAFTAGLPLAAGATPLDEYVAARDKAIAEMVAAAKAGKSDDDAVVKREAQALEDLGNRMISLVGPVNIKGLGSPTYSMDVLFYVDGQPSEQLDGVSVADDDGTTRVIVTPAPIFESWLAARGKDADAPPGFGDGLKAAAGTEYFYDAAFAFPGGGYTPYVALPVMVAGGETVYAWLGLYTDEMPADLPPNEITLVRIADDQVMVGITEVKLEGASIAACDAIWQPYDVKVSALQEAVDKDNKPDDPRWDQIAEIGDEGGAAFRKCFAEKAKDQPFFAAATKQAEQLLQAIRAK